MKNEANINRAAIEHRALWMGLIYDEARKRGADAEAICRAAIKRCGKIHGARHLSNCADATDLKEFRKVFLNDLTMATFDMKVTENDAEHLRIDFHYCPLVKAWKEQGFDNATCARLCDIAMDGDRGIAEIMGYKLELTDTIAGGCPCCKLHFHR